MCLNTPISFYYIILNILTLKRQMEVTQGEFIQDNPSVGLGETNMVHALNINQTRYKHSHQLLGELNTLRFLKRNLHPKHYLSYVSY